CDRTLDGRASAKGTADQTAEVSARKNPGTRPTTRLERQPEQASAGSKVRPGPRAPDPTSYPPTPRGCSGQDHYQQSPWHLWGCEAAAPVTRSERPCRRRSAHRDGLTGGLGFGRAARPELGASNPESQPPRPPRRPSSPPRYWPGGCRGSYDR